MKQLMAIGMIAFLSMDATALPFAETRAAGAGDVSHTQRATQTPGDVVSASISETLRVRIAQVRQPMFSLSGINVAISGFVTAPGYHAYKFKKLIGDEWLVADRDTGKQIGKTRSPKISGESLRLNLTLLPASVVIGARDVIATLDLETYLRGVLPAEMPASWPQEALKAQAIAARTFALYRRDHSAHQGFDLDSDVMDQMFAQPTNPSTDRAIKETEGVVLEDRHHKLFAAYFHADCGGHTEDASNVWGAGESMGTAIDPGCPMNPKANWSLRLTSEQLSNRLRQIVHTLEPGARTSSGRFASVKVNGVAIASNEFRTKLGFNELKSTAFSISREGDAFVFRGQGYGHGVGLCQWGARQLAKAGRGYREILAHYYPRASVRLTPLAAQSAVASGASVSNRHPHLNDEKRNGT